MAHTLRALTAASLVLACGPGRPSAGSAESSSASTGPQSTDSSAGSGGVTGEPACDDDPRFTASWAAWRAAAGSHGDTYYYRVQRGLYYFDEPKYCVHQTLVAVVEGKVVERRFTLVDAAGGLDCAADFVEKGEEVGTHNPAVGAPAVTFDALYIACCDMVIHIEPADEYAVSFVTDEAGLMRSCSYEINACGEPCSGGPLGDVLDVVALEFGDPPAP